MRVRAKHNVTYNGQRYAGGEVFDVTREVYRALTAYVDCIEKDSPAKDAPDDTETNGFVSEVFPSEQADQPKRSRKKKTTD